MVKLNLEERFSLIEYISKLPSTKELFIEVNNFFNIVNLSKDLALDPNANWGFEDGRVTWDFNWEKENVPSLEVEIPSVILKTIKSELNLTKTSTREKALLSKIGVLNVSNEI